MVEIVAVFLFVVTFATVLALATTHEIMTATYYKWGHSDGEAVGRRKGFKAGLKKGRAFQNPPHSWR